MRRDLALCVLCASLGAPYAMGAPAARAAPPPAVAAAAAASDNPDQRFYTKATEGALSEINAGMLAQRQASSPALKQFGDMLVKDHTLANQMLRGIATAKNVELPVKPDAEQAAKQAGIQALSGSAFDRAFLEWQILAHKEAIMLFKDESTNGDDADARLYAGETLPKLQAHLDALMAMPAIPAGATP